MLSNIHLRDRRGEHHEWILLSGTLSYVPVLKLFVAAGSVAVRVVAVAIIGDSISGPKILSMRSNDDEKEDSSSVSSTVFSSGWLLWLWLSRLLVTAADCACDRRNRKNGANNPFRRCSSVSTSSAVAVGSVVIIGVSSQLLGGMTGYIDYIVVLIIVLNCVCVCVLALFLVVLYSYVVHVIVP